jgi:hypothetical protein
MRTKIILTAAAAMAAGLVSSNAQVYSANVVGYIQQNLVAGFNLVSNPMDLDGTGTNNTCQSVLGTQVPCTVYAMSGGVFAPIAQYTTKGGWSSGTNSVNFAMNPGQGFFVSVASPATVTFVGNVKQGSLATPWVGGFNIIGSQVPIAGLMQHALNFQPGGNATVYTYANGSGYNPISQFTTKGGWSGAGEPNLGIGQAVVISMPGAGSWNTNFTVQ